MNISISPKDLVTIAIAAYKELETHQSSYNEKTMEKANEIIAELEANYEKLSEDWMKETLFIDELPF